jgi:hypothetical protein
MDRLARNLDDLRQLVRTLTAKGVRVIMSSSRKVSPSPATTHPWLPCCRHGQVHDLHIWQITSDQPALSAHVLVADGFHCLTVAQFLWALPPPRND